MVRRFGGWVAGPKGGWQDNFSYTLFRFSRPSAGFSRPSAGFSRPSAGLLVKTKNEKVKKFFGGWMAGTTKGRPGPENQLLAALLDVCLKITFY